MAVPAPKPIIDKNGVLYLGAAYDFISLTPPATPGGAWTKTTLGQPSGTVGSLIAHDNGHLFGLSRYIKYSTANSTDATAFEMTGSGYTP